MSRKKTISFEHSLSELEALVKKMDSGSLSLEESLTAFENGISLIRSCQAALHSAEQRVQLLIEKNGELDTVAFNDEEPE